MSKTVNKPRQNCTVVERKDSHHQLRNDELKSYQKMMTETFGNTELPAVVYKGATIPRRTLSDFSYLTHG